MDAVIHLINYADLPGNNINFMLDNMNCEVKSYSSEQDFLKYYVNTPKEHARECIILEVGESSAEAFYLIDELKRLKSIIPVIVITAYPSFETCRRAFKAGTLEFLKKPINSELLVNAIHDAFSQYEKILSKHHKYQIFNDKLSKLSAREKEVMDMILEGNTSKEAAQKLSLSQRTVEVHRSNMYTKLRIKSLPQLVQEYDFYKNYSDSI
ncbi:response regulator transcription factor [Morganella morganii]|uniref:response regulator transcription factor n=1 Tax=Morganella morganii TaxID=582 RepID=UPI00339C4407